MTPCERAIIDLARKIAALDGGYPTVNAEGSEMPECKATCDHEESIDLTCECGKRITVKHVCQHECEATPDASEIQDACEAWQDPDLALLLRELDLALVSLDLERIAS